MVRAALEGHWQCAFANDFDHKKCATYVANWGNAELRNQDVGTLAARDLPGVADLAWASFPCQDLSLAGGGAGLKGDRSGTFWPFWKLMSDLVRESRAPKIITLENVCGTLTSHNGADFAAICSAYVSNGYRVGAVVIDAANFVAQSRPRLFIVGVREDARIPEALISKTPDIKWHTPGIMKAFDKLPKREQESWIWWALPTPSGRKKSLRDCLDFSLEDHEWHSKAQTRELIAMMDKVNRDKLARAKQSEKLVLGTMYRRTRPDRRGGTVQRIEARFDGIAGCLRTPAGGSSRQLVIRVLGEEVRTRLLTVREAANLMGLPRTYKLPENYNEGYHLVGDGVVVPVVRFLSTHIFEGLISGSTERERVAA